eukprot:16181601-Heterocapsa_arctica.AAC.1
MGAPQSVKAPEGGDHRWETHSYRWLVACPRAPLPARCLGSPAPRPEPDPGASSDERPSGKCSCPT